MELYYFSSGPRERVLNAILEANHKIQGIFVTDPQSWPKIVPTIELAKRHGLPIRIVSKSQLDTLTSELSGTVCLSVGFAFLFSEKFIKSVKICLNVHGTLLPHYAGLRTLNWVIENGERESGVTVHQIDTGVDTGPILLQKSFPVSVFDTGMSLYRKTLEFEPDVVVEALSLYESGRSVSCPQERSAVFQYPNRIPEHSQVDPSKPLAELFDKIRAADPIRYPAYFYLEGQKVCIKLWRPNKPQGEEDMI